MMRENERKTKVDWNPFAQLMAFVVAVIGASFIPWMTRLLHHIGLTPYEFSHPHPSYLPGATLVAGFAHLTGGLIVLRTLARVPCARWWHYAIGRVVGSYLTIIFAVLLFSFDEAGTPEVCWPCLFAPRNCLLFWPTAILWGLTYWYFAIGDVAMRVDAGGMIGRR
jgi:hypothetical protein